MSPRSNRKISTWSAVNFEKHLTSISCKLEPAIWSRDTGQRIPCFDRRQFIITWISNIKEVHSKPRLHISVNLLFGEHRRAVEKAITQRDIDQPTAVSDHFTLPGHSLNNLELIPLELINSNRDAIRKAREAFFIYKGKTLKPSGMNRCDEI